VRPQRLLDPPQQFHGLQVAQISDLKAMKLKVVGDRGELRDRLLFRVMAAVAQRRSARNIANRTLSNLSS
jgi:hypothetical protein